MIELTSSIGPSTIIGGVLGLLFAFALKHRYVPQDHGAGIPQHPKSRKFTSDANAFSRWLFIEFVAFIGGAVVGNLLGARLPTVWASLTGIEQMGISFAGTLLVLLVLERVYRADVYDG